jgi:hypothetical protein
MIAAAFLQRRRSRRPAPPSHTARTCPQAFCAGGDVKAAVQAAASGAPGSALDFFKHEYRVDYMAGSLPMPQVAHSGN